MLRISEIFQSYQGEGLYAGVESISFRLTGCNLRCWFCDTPYSSWVPEGEHIEVSDILTTLAIYDARDVILTGGEPLLQPEIIQLSEDLTTAGFRVTLETAGTVFREVQADLISISPKRPNSAPQKDIVWKERHLKFAHRPETIKRFVSDYSYQFKFVLEEPDDISDVLIYLEEFPEIKADYIWLMAQGREPAELEAKEPWIREAAKKHGFNHAKRVHIHEFGNLRGK